MLGQIAAASLASQWVMPHAPVRSLLAAGLRHAGVRHSARPQPAPRIVAVGDLHGDYQAWQDIARAAGLIDAQRPLGGRQDDPRPARRHHRPAPDSLKIVRSLQQLQQEAPRAGGRVVVVLGNHEAMNLLGDYRYTTPGEYAAFVDDRSPRAASSIYMPQGAARSSSPRPTRRRRRPGPRGMDGAAPARLGRAQGWPGAPRASSADGRRATPPSSRSATHCSSTAASAPNIRSCRSTRSTAASPRPWPRATRASRLDPQRSARARSGTAAWSARPGCRGGAREAAPGAHPAPAEQELNAVLSAYGAKRLVIGHTPEPQGHRDPLRRTAGPHRYRHFALLRRAAQLARNRRRAMIPHTVARPTP